MAFLSVATDVVPGFWDGLAVARRARHDGGDADAEIATWARSHNLDVDWVRAAAADVVLRGRVMAALLPRRPFEESPLGRRDHPIPSLAWDPKLEAESAFRRRVEDYVVARRTAVEAAGSGQDHADPDRLRRDLHRLVRWQVLLESPDRIAAGELAAGRKGARRTVAEEIRKALAQLAAIMGLPTRPRGRAGRPRKSPC